MDGLEAKISKQKVTKLPPSEKKILKKHGLGELMHLHYILPFCRGETTCRFRIVFSKKKVCF